jgi:hypothetical protein
VLDLRTKFLASVAAAIVDDSLSSFQVAVYVAMNVTKKTFPDKGRNKKPLYYSRVERERNM